ncbi:MAG TPA: HlyC/CorC family transporter, partial [Calditrichaeota bacterium]|nr:HlyC/CorC family transporter [Calditrichota bacterium]
ELVEEVFGRFLMEEEKGLEIKALNDHTWLIDARYELDDLKERLAVSFPSGEFETLAGLIMNQTGRIPKIKEEIVFPDFRLVIVSASSKRIHKVKLIKKLE